MAAFFYVASRFRLGVECQQVCYRLPEAFP